MKCVTVGFMGLTWSVGRACRRRRFQGLVGGAGEVVFNTSVTLLGWPFSRIRFALRWIRRCFLKHVQPPSYLLFIASAVLAFFKLKATSFQNHFPREAVQDDSDVINRWGESGGITSAQSPSGGRVVGVYSLQPPEIRLRVTLLRHLCEHYSADPDRSEAVRCWQPMAHCRSGQSQAEFHGRWGPTLTLSLTRQPMQHTKSTGFVGK